MPISNQSSWDPIEKFGLASLIRLTAGNEHRIGLRERVALFICSLSLSLSLSLALCHQSFFFLALSTHQTNLNRNDRRIWSECLSGAKTEKDKKKDWFLLFDSFFFCLRWLFADLQSATGRTTDASAPPTGWVWCARGCRPAAPACRGSAGSTSPPWVVTTATAFWWAHTSLSLSL